MFFEPDKLTLGVSLTILAIIIAYDVWTLTVRGYATTISWNMFQMASRFPIIACALGIVLGHLFWPNAAGTKCP